MERSGRSVAELAERTTARRAQLAASIDALLRKLADHVSTAMAEARLPRLARDHGLGDDERVVLRARWPDASAAWSAAAAAPARPTMPAHPLLDPLHAMLTRHRGTDPASGVWANVLAAACFGPHHLWQDLGAAGRDEVTRLMAWGFPALHASNVRDLRWKRHLFLELGRERGEDELRPPKCDACDQRPVCFADPPGAALVIRVQSAKL